jgi:dipeptidyl aminopeptidase/acylaminoacyl peptidase
MTLPTPSLDELYQLERIRHARLLPKGAGAVFVVSRVVDDVEKYDVRTVALDGDSQRTVAKDLANIGALAPSPDGEIWACIAPFNGKPQIAFMNPDNGALRAVTSLPQGVGGPPVWSPCGQWLAFTAIGEERLAKGPYDTVRTSSIFYKADGVGFAQRTAQDIFVLSRQWCEVRRLTHGPASHGGVAWSPVPGATELCFSTSMEAEGLVPSFSAGVLDLQGRVRWVRRQARGLVAGVAWAGDGERLLLVREPEGQRDCMPRRLYVAPLADGERAALASRTEALHQATGADALNAVLSSQMGWLAHGPVSPAQCDHAFVCTQTGGHSAVHRVALSGPESCEAITPADIANFLVDADATHVLTAATGYNATPDLYVSDHQGAHRRRLTALNDAFLATRALPTVHELNFTSADGAALQAWFIRPTGATGPVATFVDIHGGPQCAWGPSWYHGAQMLAARGIATLMPNPRGSNGYGAAHIDAILPLYNQPADADVLAAVDEAVCLGLADPDRLGIGGISYGGILSSWIIGHTDRFKCALPEQLICNWISAYGQSDAGGEIVRMNFGVSVAEGFQFLWEQSSLSHAHKVSTPTLIIQCENDLRCPMGEAEQFFMALKQAGCMVDFMRMPGSHGAPQLAGITQLARPRDEAVLEWLTRFLRP